MADEVLQRLYDGIPRLLSEFAHDFSQLSPVDREQCVEGAFADIVESYRADPARYSNWHGAFVTAARHDALDRVKRLRRRSTASEPDDAEAPARTSPPRIVTAVPLDDIQPTGREPESWEQTLGNEKRQRRGLLLSDVLREFCRECEERGHLGRRDRQIVERVIRSDWNDTVAARMFPDCRDRRGPANSVNQIMHQTTKWLRKRVAQRDVRRSVAATFVGEVEGRPRLTPRQALDLLWQAVVEFRGMCPSDERLGKFHRKPNATELSDVRYHVLDARGAGETRGCASCQTRLERLGEVE